MIHQNSIIQWMDLVTKEVYEKEISYMFGQYISKSKQISDDVLSITFDHDDTKVVDWKGWSAVNSFDRQSNIKTWIKLITKHGKTIVGTPDTLIMIYDPTKVSKGFHGETKYQHLVIPFVNISNGDIVRVRHTIDGNGSNIDFDTIDRMETFDTDPCIGYQIITKSGFFNCNDFYLFGRSQI